MKNETPEQRKLRLQNLLRSIVKNINQNYDFSVPTKVYLKDERLHVKGQFWNEAVAAANIIGLSSMIVEYEHVYFF